MVGFILINQNKTKKFIIILYITKLILNYFIIYIGFIIKTNF